MDGVSDERRQERALTASLYVYRNSVVAFVNTFADLLTKEQSRQVHRLIDHGEPVEALVFLAQFVVDGGQKISSDEHDHLLSLIEGSESRRFLPPNLDDAITP